MRLITKLAFALAILAAPLAASAADYQAGDLKIQNPHARATPGGARVGGGYMTIVNNGTAADRLVGGTAEIAGRVEVHEMKMEEGVMRMRPIEGGLEIAAGATVELKPGGYHIMLMELKAPLKEGDEVPLTLTFEKAGNVDIKLAVQAMGEGMKMEQGSGGHNR